MSGGDDPLSPRVAIVGGGPSGLTAAASLARELGGDVLVLDRERETGGIPRHSAHTGYGWRDLRRNLTGPDYARRLTDAAVEAGATIWSGAMVTHLGADRTVEVTTPAGRMTVVPSALILATGARERPRSARLVAGDRPAGVYTTGQLQNLVHLHHGTPGRRAVVVGAELVSWSAVLTLRDAGCKTVLMTTEYSKPDTYGAVSLAGRGLLRVKVASATRVVRIIGRDRVRAVLVQDIATGVVHEIECDTVVFSGDWIPDNELARGVGLDMEPGSKAPRVDASLRTSSPGVFAIGNLIHPVDTADVAALDGRHVEPGVLAWLRDGCVPPAGANIVAAAPLRWVTPSRLSLDDSSPSRDRLLAWCDEWVRTPKVVVSQGGRVVTTHRLAWPAAPGRIFRIPWKVLARVDHRGADVAITVS
jgi:thioredoxin reductase